MNNLFNLEDLSKFKNESEIYGEIKNKQLFEVEELLDNCILGNAEIAIEAIDLYKFELETRNIHKKIDTEVHNDIRISGSESLEFLSEYLKNKEPAMMFVLTTGNIDLVRLMDSIKSTVDEVDHNTIISFGFVKNSGEENDVNMYLLSA